MFSRAARFSSAAVLIPSISALFVSKSAAPTVAHSDASNYTRLSVASGEYAHSGTYDRDGRTIRLFGGSAHPALNKEIARYLSLPPGRIFLSKFADGETHIQVRENVREKTVYIIAPTISNDSLVELILTISCMRRASAAYIVAVMPYFGYARQDRKHDREPIAAADIARILEEAGVDRVTAVDLHSGQIQGFFYCPVDNVQPFGVAAGYFAKEVPALLNASEKVVVVAAHENQVHRANLFRSGIDQLRSEQQGGAALETQHKSVNFAVLARSRNRNGENIPYLVGDVEGATCIVIDDIVNTGSTITSAVRSLKEHGAKKVYAFATHAVFDDKTMSILDSCQGLDFLLVTNSIPMQSSETSDKLRRVSIAPLLGETIKRIQDGRPFDEMHHDNHIPCPAVPCRDD